MTAHGEATSDTEETTAASANPRAWHHAMVGGTAVFLLVAVGSALVLRSAVFAFASFGAFAGTAVAAVLAERAPTHWPWYAYVVMPVGAVALVQALLIAAS